MQAEDVVAVTAIEGQSPGPWTAEQLRGQLQSSGAVALVTQDGPRARGYLFGRHCTDEAELLRIGVDADSRRQGLGRQLLDAFLQELPAKAVTRCFAEVRVSNGAARALYEQAGFSAIARRPRYYQNPCEDAVVMRLNLSPRGVSSPEPKAHPSRA